MEEKEAKVGYIYILTNPSFKEYIKIGYADNVDQRVAQLNISECVPFAFRKYATYKVQSRLADKTVHRMIDSLNSSLRSIEVYHGKTRTREFYAMTPQSAFNFLQDIASLNGKENDLIKYELSEKEKEDEKVAEQIERNYIRNRKKLTFSQYQIPIGAELVYTKNKNIKCKVISENKVEYKGKQYSLSALAGKLNLESGSNNIHVAGTDVFSYNGETLSTDIRNRLGI